MNAKQKTLLVVGLCVAGWWSYRLYHQHDQLNQVERTLPYAMQQIEQGGLRNAEDLIVRLEAAASAIRSQWAALPYIRRREETCTSHLANLRKVHQKKVTLVETAAVSVIQSVRAGKIDEAEKILQAAVKESGQADGNLSALTGFLNRFKVQDFRGAEEAARRLTGTLTQNVPISQSAALALTNYSDVVQVEKKANYDSHARIASEVKSTMNLSSSRESSSFRPTLKGRAMIWDSTKDAIDMAYELLPDNLRASSRDGVVTIFCIGRRENILQGYYSVSRQPGYKEKMSIGVVYWPAKENAGTAIVWGGDPAHTRPVTHSPGYGSSVNIRNWIASLPTE